MSYSFSLTPASKNGITSLMIIRPIITFRFANEAQFQEVKEVVERGYASSMNEFIVVAIAKRLDELLGGGGPDD